MSDVKYTIVIDDKALIQSFKEHERLADNTSVKIASSYESAAKEIDATSDAANGLSKSIDKVNSSLDLSEALLGNFDKLQRIIAIAAPIMANYGITLADVLRPLEIIGVHSRVTANNLENLNNALISFKMDPTAEGFRNIEIAVISLGKQFNGFQSSLLSVGLSFRDLTNEFSNFSREIKDVYKEIFGLEPTLKMLSSSALGYGSNILKLIESNKLFSQGLLEVKTKALAFSEAMILQINSSVILKDVYAKIQSAIDLIVNSFNSAKQVIQNIVAIFEKIKSKFLELFSSMEKNSNLGESISNLLIVAFGFALSALKSYFSIFVSSVTNALLSLFLFSPAIIGIGVALATSLFSGFYFTWFDLIKSGKFITQTAGSFSQAFSGIFPILLNNIKSSFMAFESVLTSTASLVLKTMFNSIKSASNTIFSSLMPEILSKALSFLFATITAGMSGAFSKDLIQMISVPFYIIESLAYNITPILYKSFFKLQDLFLTLKYKWELDIKGISQLLNVFKNDIIGVFSSIAKLASTAFSNIDFSAIGSSLKKGFEPAIGIIKFFIPKMAQEFLGIIGSIESVGDAFITMYDIMYRVFTSKLVQDGISKIISSFEFLRVRASIALDMIRHYGSSLTQFIPKSVTEFYDLIKTIKSFDDALIVSGDIIYRVFTTYLPIIKQFGLSLVSISKDVYSKVIASFIQLGSVISANIPNSIKEVISLVRSMKNIDEIGSVAVKSFNILYNAMSASILSTMPMITSYFKKFYDIGMTGFVQMYVSLTKYTDAIKAFGLATFTSLSTVISQFSGLISLTPQFISLLQQMFPVISKVYKGVAGIGYGAGNWSGIMALAIPLLAQFNGGLGQTIGLSLTLAGIIGGALSYAFSKFITGIGKAISYISDFFVELGKGAAESYIKIKSTFDILIAVIQGVSRSTDKAGFNALDFTSRIAQMAQRWNMSMVDIAKGTQELVLVGSQLGLTADQVHNLTEVVAQYAKINKESVYDAAIAFGSALNGNSQSVLKYGVKLSDANTQHYLFLSGQEKLLSKMSDAEKVQSRYNNVLKQFGVVAGVADVASRTLADQANALKTRIEFLSAKFGEGSLIIENTNIFAYALNKTLALVSDNMAFLGGIATSLFGRLGQLIGQFLQLSIKIFVTIKAFTLLKILLESKFWADFATKTIPLIGLSFQALVNNLAKSEVKLNSIRGLLSGFGKIGINEIKSAFVNVGIVVGGNITLMAILTGITAKFGVLLRVIAVASAPFLAFFAEWGLIIAAVVAALYTLYKAFKFIEERTQLFSTIWQVLTDEFSRTSEFIELIKNGFVDAFRTIATWAEKAVGVVIYSINGMITPLIYAATLLGKKFISAESYDKLKQLQFRLNGLNQSLLASGFSLTAFGERAIASASDIGVLVDKTKILEDIMKMSTDLSDAGKSQLQILAETNKQRLDLLSSGLKNEVINLQRYNQIKKLVDADYHTKRTEEVKKQLEGFNSVMKTISTVSFASEMARLDFENSERIAKIKDAGAQHLKSDQEVKAALLLNEKYFNEESRKLKIENVNSWSDFGDAIKASFKDVKITVKDLVDAIHNALVNGIAQGMQWVGRSLAQHSADWKDLQKGMGNILAGLASQFGNYCIAVGMGMTATGPIAGWSGAAAISAGLALNVLAGALGTMGGDSPGTNMAGSQNVQNTLGPDMNQLPGAPDKSQRQEPQNVLNVTINGDVLDSDESSMRIVKLINEAYDKKGVVLRQGAFA